MAIIYNLAEYKRDRALVALRDVMRQAAHAARSIELYRYDMNRGAQRDHTVDLADMQESLDEMMGLLRGLAKNHFKLSAGEWDALLKETGMGKYMPEELKISQRRPSGP